MLIATFGPTTGWVGKTITREGDVFILEGHGPITAANVMEYDRQRQLVWANDGMRAWVGAQSKGESQAHLVATFNSSTGWAGKTITYDNGVFTLGGHGVISAADVLTYDRQGQIAWAYDGLREWVQQLAATSPVAAPHVRPVGFAPWQTPASAQGGGARSHTARNIIIGVGAALVLLVVIVAAASGPTTTTTLTGAPGTTSDSGGNNAKAGPAGAECFYSDYSGRAVVTLISVTDSSQPQDTTLGEEPQHGVYAVCDISIKCTDGTYAFNPLYFKYQAPDGSAYDTMSGNATWAGFEPQLDSGTLTAGQNTHGYVTFDVPAGASGALIQLLNPVDDVAFEWNR